MGRRGFFLAGTISLGALGLGFLTRAGRRPPPRPTRPSRRAHEAEWRGC